MTDSPQPRTRPRWSWLSFLVGFAGALVILGGIWGGIAIKQAVDAQRQADYEACLLAHGYDVNDPGAVTTDEELDDAIEASGNCI